MEKESERMSEVWRSVLVRREDKPACAVLRVRSLEHEAIQRESGGHSTADPTSRERRQQKAGALLLSGDNSLRDPPVPIPNTEVKPQHADSTWLETAR